MYSRVVQQLVHDLPNRGRLESATHGARGENPICGDQVELSFQVCDDQVMECRFQARGCPAAIASAAAITQLVRDRTTKECLDLSPQILLDYLGGLPPHKLHGADLAIEILRRALEPS